MASKIIKKPLREDWDKQKPDYTRLSLEKVDKLLHATLNP